MPLARCPVCEASAATRDSLLTAVVGAEPPEQLVRCADCGLVRREPRMSFEHASDVYDDAYYEQYEGVVGMSGDAGGEVRPHLKARLVAVERLVGVGKLLEVGCGKGFFMDYARSRGWRVKGVEVSEVAGNIARAKGLDVHIGPIELLSPTEPVDFVHMNHVLEHLADPVAVLKQVRTMLAPDGIAIIEVPNEFDNFFFGVGRTVLPHEKLTQPIRSTHQFFFSPKTFRLAVAKAGLTVVSCRTVRWGIGDRSGVLGRTVRWALYVLERRFDRAGNIEAILKR